MHRAIGVAAFAAAMALAGIALAAPESLREGLFGPRGANVTVGRYVSEDGDAFILDRSQPRPLLKFEDSPEVWALQATPAPRGDVIYKNDIGEPVLRMTRLGGMTVFTELRPDGAAAALMGGGLPLQLGVLGPQLLLERLAQASARTSRAARRLIPFDAEAGPVSSAVIADAAMVTSEALIRLSRRTDARKVLGRVQRVRLVQGKKPGADVDDGTLRVTVAPGMGQAGRPSSERIVSIVRR